MCEAVMCEPVMCEVYCRVRCTVRPSFINCPKGGEAKYPLFKLY